MSVRRRVVGLCALPVSLCVIDGALTLMGQSTAYRAGDRSAVNELSPVFRDLLVIHPAAFALGLLSWAAVFVLAMLIAHGALASIFSVAVTLGHCLGAMSWIAYGSAIGYQLGNGLVLVTAAALALGIRHAARGSDLLFAIAPRTRWASLGMLVAIGVYLFLWPHPR